MRPTSRIPLESIKPELFWKFVERQVSGCWKWVGQQEGSKGRRRRPGKGVRLAYGVYECRDRRYRAHRVSYELTHGQDTAQGKFVCHRCDYPLCVNPEHLFLGTAKTNTADMVTKGRASPGKQGGRPKGRRNRLQGRVTSTEMDAIRRAYDEESITYRELGKRHGLSADYVGRIIRSS